MLILDDRQIIGLILEKYKIHLSILATNQNPTNNFNSFSFHDVEVCKVRNQFKSMDGRNSTDQIPSELVLLAADKPALP